MLDSPRQGSGSSEPQPQSTEGRAKEPVGGRPVPDAILRRFSWDDLRIVAAIGRTRLPSAAAALLGLNISTVSRRLSRVEQALGVRLFDRRRTGYVPTDQGEELIALGGRVELDIVTIIRRVSTHDQGVTGTLRITTSDSLLLHFFTPIIAAFKADNPAIRIEVLVGNSALNLARGESDVALRATKMPPENLFGCRIAAIAWAPYGRRSNFPAGPPPLDQLYQLQWVSYAAELSALKAFTHVETLVAPERIAYRVDSVASVGAAISAGLGIGLLPCMLGDLVDDLVRVGPILPELTDDLWLLTHPDIRKAERVRAFMAFCAAATARQRAFIEGQAPPLPVAKPAAT